MNLRLPSGPLAISFAFAILLPAASNSAPIHTIVTFDPTLGELPESLTADDHDNLYVSVAGSVRKIDPSGAVSPVATLPLPAGAFSGGIKIGPDGSIYVASGAFSPSPNAAFVWRISGGAVAAFAELDPNGFPNDLAFDGDGNAYVTDSFLGRIWKIDPQGVVSVWLSDPLFDGNAAAPALPLHAFGVDGIAFDKGKKNLYVTNLDYGEILRIPFDSHGYPGPVHVFADDARLQGADGLAFDDKGNLYVAVNAQDQIVVIDKHARLDVVEQGDPLDSPSSLVFGTGDCDRTTLYLSNFAIARAIGAKPGTPHPAILSFDVPHPGLPLP
jgi:sugar lactone lactonase YvrE